MAINMNKIIEDLKSYGIHDAKELVYNPSYDELYKEELKWSSSKACQTAQASVR